MARERRSPQEKKRLEYTRNHFTFGRQSSRTFPKVWKRKKAYVNRSFRRIGDGLLAQAKPGIPAEEAVAIGEDVTIARIEKLRDRRALHKGGTVSVGEKVKLKLERRKEMVRRRVGSHEKYDRLAASAVETLTSLSGEQLAEVAHRASRLCHFIDQRQILRLRQSSDPIDQALHFFRSVSWGSAPEKQALCRNKELWDAWSSWIDAVNRILRRDRRPSERKEQEKVETEKKLKAVNRASRPSE